MLLASELAAEKCKRQEIEQLLRSLEEDQQQQGERLAVEERRCQDFQSQVDGLKQMVANLHLEVEKRESHIDSAEKENSNLAKELAERSVAFGTSRQKVSELSRKLAAEEEKSTNLHRKAEEKSANVNELEAKLKEKDFEQQKLMEKLRDHPLQDENEWLKSRVREMQDQLTSANQSLLDTEAELAALRNERQMDGKSDSTTLFSELKGLDERERAAPSFGESIFTFTGGQKETSTTSIFSQPYKPVTAFTWSWDRISVGTQTDEVKVEQDHTEAADIGVSTSDASAQTARVGDVQSSTQTENPRMKDASVLTDPVFIRKLETDEWKKFLSVMSILISLFLLLSFYFREQGVWTAANDVSRQALISRNGSLLSPWWYQAAKYQFTVWLQVDRALSG